MRRRTTRDHIAFVAWLAFAIALGILIGKLDAQTAGVKQLQIWNGTQTIWATLGPNLLLSGTNTLDVRKRSYNIKLEYDATNKVWLLPYKTVTNVVIYCNGLRMRLASDYGLYSGKIQALADTMQPDSLVVADYDQ